MKTTKNSWFENYAARRKLCLPKALLIEIQLAMIRAAQRVIFCFDSTKFGRLSVSPLCGLDRLHVIVTDQAAPADLVRSLRERGIEVVIAAQEGGGS